MRYTNVCTKNKNKARNVTKMLQILQLYYIFKKRLNFINFMYIISVANNKKNIPTKKGGAENMKLTKKQKKILIKNIKILSKMLLVISLVYIDIVLALLVF